MAGFPEMMHREVNHEPHEKIDSILLDNMREEMEKYLERLMHGA